jgi:hypothetical protein
MSTRTQHPVLKLGLALGVALAVASPPSSSPAVDGYSAVAPTSSYYESVSGGEPIASLESAEAGHPVATVMEDTSATLRYEVTSTAPDQVVWQVALEDFARPHERVDAVYDLVLVLPLPADANGKKAFRALQRRIELQEGVPGASVALVYAGEPISLKRNVGYAYTVWDTIVAYDAAYGDVVQAHASFGYTTDESVLPPDASDERLKGYLITWIPSLGSEVPPFTLRIDVSDAGGS